MAFTSLRKFCDDRRGNMTVEFAFVSLILITLVFGVFEGMNLVQAWSNLQWACDTTARYAMANSTMTTAQIQSYAASQAATVGLSSSTGATFTVTSSTPPGTVTSITVYTITGTYTYKFVTKFMGGRVSLPLTASTTAPMV